MVKKKKHQVSTTALTKGEHHPRRKESRTNRKVKELKKDEIKQPEINPLRGAGRG